MPQPGWVTIKSEDVEKLGNYGAFLSLIEVGLGSVLHSIKFPFTGFILSLNQGYLLCRISIKTQNPWMGYHVSNIAAILKSFSPAGNKLGPMLSLSMQGLLFNLGTLFGINLFGLIIGMILLSMWSFIQPLLTYYLFFGEKIFHAAEYLFQKTLPFHGIEKSELKWFFLGLVLLKCLIGICLAILAWKNEGESHFQDRLVQLPKVKKIKQGDPLKLALKDLTKPLFVLSLVLTGVFLYFSQHNFAQIIWYLMRPVGVAFIFFYFSRTLTLDKWIYKLRGGRFDFFAKGIEIALTQVRKII